jgi:hypothetical protein
MFDYWVVHAGSADAPVTLRDELGRLHLARVLSGQPALGSRLHGAAAWLGFGLLQCHQSGQIFRVTFVAVDGQTWCPPAHWQVAGAAAAPQSRDSR